MAEEKEYKLFDNERTALKPIFGRQDVDEALYYLKPYKMMKLDKPDEPMEDVANVTLNDCLLYAAKAISILGGATMQAVIKGRKLSDKQTTLIEQFLEDIYYAIDELLEKRGIWGLGAFTDEQIMIRGHVAARPCLRLNDDGSLCPDVTPLDTRFFVPKMGPAGIIWGAPWFSQTKEELQEEYNKPGDTLPNVQGGENEVVDLWNQEENIAFVKKEVARRQLNTYGYPPFVYSIVHAGSMFYSKDAMEHKGESILWANRALWTEKNRTATILQTLDIQALFGALQYDTDNPDTIQKPKTSPYQPKSVHPVKKGEGFRLIPVNDIKRATTLFYTVLEADLQRGSLAAVDYGTLEFPLSSLALARLMGSRNDIFLPRVNTKAVFYQALSRMIIDQCISLGQTIAIGPKGSENEYNPDDLKGDYTIQYRFYTESAEQKIANFTIARDASTYYSRDTIRREYLHDKNPDGEEIKFQSQQVEMLDEAVFLFRRALSLVRPQVKGETVSMDNQIESYLLCQRARTILMQRNAMGQLSPIEGNRFAEVESQAKPEEKKEEPKGRGQRRSMLTQAIAKQEAEND